MNRGKIGFRIGKDFTRPENLEPFAELKSYGTPAVSDAMNRFNTMDAQIKPFVDDLLIGGPALTVRMRAGDNLMLHKAIALAQPGDVIVVDTTGTTNYSVLGDLMSASAMKMGIAGIIVDGAVRDVGDLKKHRYPIFAKAVIPAVGDKAGPGEINYPISCGGVPVLPGDYIIADNNGVVVVKPEELEEVLEGARKKMAYEKIRRQEIEEGNIAKADIDEILRNAGVI